MEAAGALNRPEAEMVRRHKIAVAFCLAIIAAASLSAAQDDPEPKFDSHLVGVLKPDPAIFRIALERMSLEAGRTVFVGDMPEIDVKGAKAAGIVPILLDRHDLHTEVPSARIRSLDELPGLVKRGQV